MSDTDALPEYFNAAWDDWRLDAAEALVAKDVHRLSQQLQHAEKMLSAIRLEQEKRRLRAHGISLQDTIGLVRKVQADFDRYGQLSVETAEHFTTIIDALDHHPEPIPPDAPF